MGLFVCVFVFGRRSVIGCFAFFGIHEGADAHTDAQTDGHTDGEIAGGRTDCGADGKSQTHINRKIMRLAVGFFLVFHGIMFLCILRNI